MIPPQSAPAPSAGGDGLAALDRFTVLSATGGFLGRDDFLQFIHNAETGVKERGLFEGRGPLAILLLVPYMLLAAGVGAALAALQTLLRDVEHVLQVVLMILFYASPILYPISLAPAAARPWLEANPLAWFSERMREILLQGSGLVPGDLVATFGCLAVFAAGMWIFERLSPHFEDFL